MENDARTLTLQHLLDEHLRRDPHGLAFIDGERRWTYAGFDTLCRRAAAWLAGQGIGAGDRVALWAVNRIEWLALLFGAARLGAMVVAVNTRYRSGELGYILKHSRARLLVLQWHFRSIDFPAILADLDATELGDLQRVAVLDASAGTPRDILNKPAVACDLSSCEPMTGDALPQADVPLLLFTTSGTTRGPKLVIHPQRTLSYHSRCVAESFGFRQPGVRMLAALPFCGVFGLNGAMAAFAAGAPVVIIDAFDAEPAAALIRQHAVTHTFGSDEMYRRLLAVAPGPRPFPSARVFGYAAFQPGAPALAREAWQRGVPLIGLYGSSEVQALFSLQPAELPLAQRTEGGGRPASSAASVRVRDIDTHALLPPGEHGEIEIRSPGNFIGYLDNPQATADAILPDGYFRTGDIGYLRDDGTFVYLTRKGDAVRLAGFLVNPVEIEDVLKTHPEIADAQVVAAQVDGKPRLVAFLIAEAGATPHEAGVLAHVARQVAAFKVPARAWFVDAFPVTQSSNGTKIQRAKLREMADALLRESS